MATMKAITWLASVTLGVAALSASAFGSALEGWSTDLDKALEKAKAEHKSVLVEFTGSDWCPPCIAMRKNVFSKKEFVSAASKKFILVELDFPKGDPDLKKKNQPLAKKYKIEGFPTVILLNSEGKEFNRFFASQFPNTEDFLKHLDEALENKDLD
jgi:thiol:disulfide interchange protein